MGGMFEFSPLHIAYAAIGLAIVAAHWLPRFFTEREPAASPLLLLLGFAAFAFVPGMPEALDPVSRPKLWELVAEFAVITALFGTGVRIDRIVSRVRWMPTVRMLAVAMPITITAVALLGWQVAGLSLAAAILLGAVMAPTDPVLAGDVQVGPPLEGGEHPVRLTLTAEAGLNDGLAFPFVYLAVLVAASGWAPGEWGLEWLGRDVLWRIVVGALAGWAVGWLLGKILFEWPRTNQLAATEAGVVALAGVLLAYGATELVEGYGFIASFVAGVALRQSEKRHEFHQTLHSFTNAIEHSMLAVILVALGAALPVLLPALTWELAIVGIALIFVIRPLGGYLSLVGTRLKPRERIVVAFYGVRGIGSIYYLAFGLQKPGFTDERALWACVAFTILLSTLVHGLTAGIAVERVAGPASSGGNKEPEPASDAGVAQGHGGRL